MAEDLHYFTAKKITLKSNGDKNVEGLPKAWNKLTEKNIKKHIKIGEGHKVKCIRTGKLNNITVIDFDSKNAYNKAIKDYPELNEFFTTKTPKGYHVYGLYNPNIKTSTNREKKIDIRNDDGFVFGAGTIREDGLVYENFIEGSLNNEFPEPFLKYVSEKDKKIKKEPTTKMKEEKITLKKCEMILDTIHTKYLTNYDSWLKIVWAMRSDPEVSIALAKRISQKASNYEEDMFQKTYNDTKYGKEISKKTYYYYAKISNETAFLNICKSFDNCTGNTDEIANIFIEIAGDSVVCDFDENIYVYNQVTNKWRLDKTGDITCNLVEDTLKPYYELLKKTLQDKIFNEDGGDEEEFDKIAKQYKNVEAMLRAVGNITSSCGLYKVIRRKIKAVENDIRFNMLESQSNNLHFKNGVLDVMTGIFRPRDKYDYMTLTLSWDYIEEKDEIDPTIIDDINSMFHKMELRENVNKFIKSWLFYCLTGSTKEQIFLFQLGESAANGKSTLFSIMSKCFEFYTFKLDSKIFDMGYSSAHKQFIKLIKCPVRFAYIEELGSKQLDGQLLKDTVDGEINVNEMYGNADVYKSQAKINVAGNGIVSVKTDNGITRRMKVKECVSQFLPNQEVDDYENMIFIRDEELATKFESDEYKNALLHILLEHKTLTIPEEVEQYTNEIQNECDPFKSELEKYFIFTQNEDDRTNEAEIEQYLTKYSSNGIKSNMRRIWGKKDNNKVYKNKKGCYLGVRLRMDDD